MKSIQFRRSRPSALAFALALLITMLFVYALLSGSLKHAQAGRNVVSAARTSADIRMEGLECYFITEGSYTDPQEARIAAAVCAKNGGAGMVYESGGRYFIVREALPGYDGNDALEKRASGLTMKAEGSSREIAALSEAVSFLRAQATETSGLAKLLESGDADADSLLALLSVYRTQARNLLRVLKDMPENSAAQIAHSVEACAERLEDAISAPGTGQYRLIYAAACADWISLLENLKQSA